MDQFNKNTYKKKSLFQEFYGSCLGKIIILAGFLLVLFIMAVISVPTDTVMLQETEDNIRQCLQDNDSIKGDIIDEMVSNINRTYSEADTTVNDKDIMDAYHKYNTLEVVDHTWYKMTRLINNTHPQGIRVGWGIFGTVISTVYYNDMVLTTGPVRGSYNKKLLQDPLVNDYDSTSNPNLQPYHYQGNPDN